MGWGNTNVVSSPAEIKVSPSVVQLKAFTHLAPKRLGTEDCQQRLSLFPQQSVGGREGGGEPMVSYGDLPSMAFEDFCTTQGPFERPGQQFLPQRR